MSLTLGIGTGFIYLAFMAPVIWSADGNAMLEVAISLVRDHNFRVSPETGALGVDGYYYSKWYPLQSIVAVPFVAVGLALSQKFHLPAVYMSGACALVLPPLLTAATTSLVALLALRLGSDHTGARLAALSFAFGTIALVYTRDFYAEPLLGFLIVLSLYLALGKTKLSIAGASLMGGLAILAKPPGIIIGPLISAYLLSKRRPLTTVLMPLMGTVIFVLIYGLYNYVRFGNPFSFGQTWMSNVPSEMVSSVASKKSGFGLEPGILGLLISPGRGLIWYSPVVLLGIVGLCYTLKTKFWETLLILMTALGMLLINSGNWWSGGWSWGPRYLLPVFPILLSFAALLKKQWRYALVSLALIGFLVNAPNLVSFYERYYVEVVEQKISPQQELWSVDYAAFRQGWRLASDQIHDAMRNDIKNVFRASGKHELRGENTRIVAVWWWMLPIMGIPHWIGGGIAIVMTGIGVWLIRPRRFSEKKIPIKQIG